MLSPATRVACAAAGTLLLAATAVLISIEGLQRIEILPLMFGTVVLAPAAFGGGASRRRDAGRVEEDARRMRNAALFCFAVAMGLYVFVLVAGASSQLAQNAASLAVAFWIVALLLTFAFAFLASRRRALAREERM